MGWKEDIAAGHLGQSTSDGPDVYVFGPGQTQNDLWRSVLAGLNAAVAWILELVHAA